MTTLMGFMGAALTDMAGSDSSAGTNELQTVQAIQVGNGGIQYALDKIDQGLDPSVDDKSFGAGAFTIETDPDDQLVTVTGEVGDAKRIQSLTTDFAEQVTDLNVQAVTYNGTNLKHLELTKDETLGEDGSHSAVIVSGITVTWNWGLCAQNITCEVDGGAVSKDKDKKDKDDEDSDDDSEDGDSEDDSSEDDGSDDDDSGDDSSEDDDSDSDDDGLDSRLFSKTDDDSGDDSSEDDDSGDDSSEDDSSDDEAKTKVTLCHNLTGNPHSITVSSSAESAHLGHGDTAGACPDDEEAAEEEIAVCEGYETEVSACSESTGGAAVDAIKINGEWVVKDAGAASGTKIDFEDMTFSTDQVYEIDDIQFTQPIQDESWFQVTIHFADGTSTEQSFKFSEKEE